jgi:hypothetical protein
MIEFRVAWLGGNVEFLESLAVGVKIIARSVGAIRDNEKSVAAVRGADRCRGYTIPFRIIPARGQVPENSVESPRTESCNVFHENASRSKVANGIGIATPESRPLAGDASAPAGEADVLARESPADDVRSFNGVPINRCNVTEARGVGESQRHDLAGIGVDFAICNGVATKGFEAKVNAPNAGEQTKNRRATQVLAPTNPSQYSSGTTTRHGCRDWRNTSTGTSPSGQSASACLSHCGMTSRSCIFTSRWCPCMEGPPSGS